MTPTADMRKRLIKLHRLLECEISRNANDSAFALLKEIATETDGLTLDPILKAPTADPRVRILYWEELFERAQRRGKIEWAIEINREIRKESARCK